MDVPSPLGGGCLSKGDVCVTHGVDLFVIIGDVFFRNGMIFSKMALSFLFNEMLNRLTKLNQFTFLFNE